MDFVILDLEWNSSYSKKSKGFMSEIIEFGAVKFNEKFEIIDTFSMLVAPQISKKLSGKVKELTNISNEELAKGGAAYTHVLSRFKKFLGKDMLMTWGTCDILAIMENTKYYEKHDRIDFIDKYCDLQYYCADVLGVYDAGQQLGLAPAAELIGLDLSDIVQHRALQDSMLSMAIFKKLYYPEKLPKYTETADALHYRLTFKPYFLTDINDPLVNKSEFIFTCDKCGRNMELLSEWTLKNRGFTATLYCNKCCQKMTGKVKFRINYNGMSIKKKLTPFSEPVEETKNNTEVNNS
ncbi:MAG: exonuclease domain-containing protein [Clostridia bacterium]|nr:exonuclease domain-containing protein [Clostridia bacterium]